MRHGHLLDLNWLLTGATVFLACASPSPAQISYVGSSTIGEHLIPEAARAFTQKSGIPFGTIEVQGSGKGLQLVLDGKAMLAGVSRSLTFVEKQKPIHYQLVGYDAVSVYVHPDNPVRNLTRQQLKDIFTGTIKNWKEVGGLDGGILCITQTLSAGRGQMVEFQDSAMDGAAYRSDRKEVDKQSDQVTMLLKERNGITALSTAFAKPGLHAVSIDGFAPDAQHVRSGAYLLSRPLILVAPAHPTREVKAFISFLLGPEGQALVAHKFVAVDDH
ncbi:MAG TPA: phosphate ABC transporter substrate-binding protein [Planctomycetota bacterium]|nr:phosphate ABC transporter substrate-binding protein [Planctomycetota bacterium]